MCCEATVTKKIVQRLAGQLTRVAALDTTDEEALHEIDIAAFGTVIVAIAKHFNCNLMTTVALKSLAVRLSFARR